MKAKIRMCVGMNDLIYYNEEKLSHHEAECLYAGNFLKDAGDLTIREKKDRFANLIDLNPQTRRAATSLVVEFPPGERLGKADLIDIARELMEGVGFGNQPYLVYRHDDTAHQHLHVISTKIKSDGDRIPESFIGVRRLQPSAREIEKRYHLATETAANQTRHNPREKIQYGKTPTWQALADTLQYVMENYRYRSVAELNAALRLYNLTVKDGAPGTRLKEHGGLLYQVLGDDGKPRNAPIKASDLPLKPTLKNLEPYFAAGNNRSITDLNYARQTLEEALRSKPAGPGQLLDRLRRNRLAAVPTFDRRHAITDLHFIDLSTKTVLTTADLGNNYTAPAIRDRLGFEPFLTPSQQQTLNQKKTLDQTRQQTGSQEQKTVREQKPDHGLEL
jgi:hypothetical protein